MLRDPNQALRFEEAEVTAGSPLIGKTLADLDLHNRVGLVIIAIRRGPKGRYVYNPTAATRVDAGDTLIVCGEPPQIEALRDALVKG
jgi:voltage-gated potassium channel